MTDDSMIQKQLDMERDSVALGAHRYDQKVERLEEVDTSPGLRLMSGLLPTLTAAIEPWLHPEDPKAPGCRAPMRVMLRDSGITAEALAVLTLRVVLSRNARRASQIESEPSMVGAGLRLGTLIREHLEYLSLAEQNAALANTISRALKTSTSERHRRGAASAAVRRHATPLDWDRRLTAQVGASLLHLLVDLNVGWETQVIGGLTRLIVRDEIVQALERMHERLRYLRPVNRPMLVPPRDWTSPDNGGFLERPLRMNKSTSYGRDAGSLEPSRYDLNLLNQLQRTEWTINRRLLAVAQAAWESSQVWPSMPERNDVPMPAKPADIDTNQEARRAWRGEARAAHEANVRLRNHRMLALLTLSHAKELAEHDKLWFVWRMCFRGRAYPVGDFVTPQHGDLGRAMLAFAEGQRLTEEGELWFQIHLANVWGVDKVSYDNRLAWFRDNERRIMECALSPLDETWWTEADSPWQFLAACLDWAAHRMDPEHKVTVPVSVDGSCNGLQHLSACLRDPVGGRATNLLPLDAPSDIYMEVLEVTQRRLEAAIEAATGEEREVLERWRDGGQVDRKLVKRPTMTTPYGVTPRGAAQQIQTEMRKRGLDCPPAEAAALAAVVRAAIADVVVGAQNAMTWMQECARRVCLGAGNFPGRNDPTKTVRRRIPKHFPQTLRWTSPNDGLVSQTYMRAKDTHFQVYYGGVQRRCHVMPDQGKELDGRRSVHGVVPNVVHCWDASHLAMTVDAWFGHGRRDFLAVHDCYGTHANDTGLLQSLLRDAFVRLHERDLLGELYREWMELYPLAKLDPPPERPQDGLDLDAVRDSPYFFA